jgi:hypothetical protein
MAECHSFFVPQYTQNMAQNRIIRHKLWYNFHEGLGNILKGELS